jgi:hypothetical protein
MCAIKAVETYEADILLLSWPPCGDAIVEEVAQLWHGEVIYIGGARGGHCATDKFFDTFVVKKVQPLPSWRGIHDRLMMGEFNGKRPNS